MATLKQRLHRKNSSGTYDVIHLETEWSMITGKPTTFPPEFHTHPASQITSGTLGSGVVATNGTDIGVSRIRNIKASTVDLTPGSSSLPSGTIYLVYE